MQIRLLEINTNEKQNRIKQTGLNSRKKYLS